MLDSKRSVFYLFLSFLGPSYAYDVNVARDLSCQFLYNLWISLSYSKIDFYFHISVIKSKLSNKIYY